MTPHNLYDRVAARCAASELPLTPSGVQDVERFLKEERRACAYDRAGVPITTGMVALQPNEQLVYDLDGSAHVVRVGR